MARWKYGKFSLPVFDLIQPQFWDVACSQRLWDSIRWRTPGCPQGLCWCFWPHKRASKYLKPSDKQHLFKLCWQKVCKTGSVRVWPALHSAGASAAGAAGTAGAVGMSTPIADSVSFITSSLILSHATPVDRASVPLEQHIADPVFEALWPVLSTLLFVWWMWPEPPGFLCCPRRTIPWVYYFWVYVCQNPIEGNLSANQSLRSLPIVLVSCQARHGLLNDPWWQWRNPKTAKNEAKMKQSGEKKNLYFIWHIF